MASVFDDEDEQEQGTPGSRVAAALAALPEEEPADDGADTRAGGQQEATEQAKGDTDTTASDVANSPYEGVSNPPQDEVTADEEPANDDEAIASYAGRTPIKAPVAPTLTPQSTAPIEAAQELANAKSDFAARQARGDFRPSVGRRIAAGLAAGMVGFGTRNAGEGLNVGEGITDAPLVRAQREEAGRESGIQSRIDAGNLENQRIDQQNKNALGQYNLEERNMRNQGYVNAQDALAEDRRARADARRNSVTNWTPKDPNNPAAGGTGRTADGRTVENVPPPDSWMKNWAKSPEGVAASLRMNIEARKNLADSIFGKGNSQSKQDWIATGKTDKAPTVKIPSAQKEQYDDWKAAFKKENGRDPNAAEIQAQGHHMSGAVSKNLTDRIISQKNVAIAKAQADYRAGKITKDDYLNSWQEAQNDFEQRLQEATGEDIHHVTIRDNVDPNTLEWHGEAPAQPKPQGQPQQAAQPAAKQAQPKAAPASAPAAAGPKTFQYKNQTFTIGQNVNVGGKPKVIVGFDPQTGKPKVDDPGKKPKGQ